MIRGRDSWGENLIPSPFIYLGALAVFEVAPAGVTECRVRVAARIHVHGADGGGQHQAPHAGVGRGLDDVPRPDDNRLDDLLLPEG